MEDDLFGRLKTAIFNKMVVEFDYYSGKEKTHRKPNLSSCSLNTKPGI